MRVCFVEDTGLHGGTQIWVSEAIRDFRRKNVDVTLLTSEGGWNAENARETDVELVTYDFDAVVDESPEARSIWTRALEGADVAVCTVHPPRASFHCSVFAARCIADAKLDTVLLPKTGTVVPEYERRFYVPEQDVRYHVIPITGFTYDYMINEYGVPPESATLVYQGTDVKRFTRSAARAAEARRRYSLPETAGPVIGCIGSFEERKGQVELLAAIDSVRKELPDVLLLLVGDGPDEEMLKRRVHEMGLERNVTFVPFTREPEMIFELLDSVVLSSIRKEGLPNVLLESMAMEIPVVSTRLAGTPEVVHDGKTGLLVQPGDVGQLADALVKLLVDRDACSAMGKAGRELVTRCHDKEMQFQAFLDVFARVSG